MAIGNSEVMSINCLKRTSRKSVATVTLAQGAASRAGAVRWMRVRIMEMGDTDQLKDTQEKKKKD